MIIYFCCELDFKEMNVLPNKLSMYRDMLLYMQSSNPISNKQTMQITQRYSFRNSIEQTVSPCIAHVQGSCFT